MKLKILFVIKSILFDVGSLLWITAIIFGIVNVVDLGGMTEYIFGNLTGFILDVVLFLLGVIIMIISSFINTKK